jgi:hypothetical protein
MWGKRTIGLCLSIAVGSGAMAREAGPVDRRDGPQTPSSNAAQPLVVAQASDAAAARQELELWSKVRDSNNPAEIESFLSAFPNGRLAPIARERLNGLRAKPPEGPIAGGDQGSRPPPRNSIAPAGPSRVDFNPSAIIGGSPNSLPPELRPNAPNTVTPVALTTGVVAEVQERLYNLNYNPGPINGRLEQATSTAITVFQRNHSLPQTGQIDEGFLTALRDAKIPTDWAALAFHARGAYSAVWQRPSRRQAENEAMTECQRRAHGKCTLATAAGAQCIGLANAGGRSRRNRSFQAYSFLAADLYNARGSVIDFCRRESPFPDTCEVRTAICADGSQNR